MQSIQFEERERKGILQLDVAGAPEVTPTHFSVYYFVLYVVYIHGYGTAFLCISQPLTVTTTALNTAENMADLIDGYCRLVNGTSSSFIVRVQKGENTHIYTHK